MGAQIFDVDSGATEGDVVTATFTVGTYSFSFDISIVAYANTELATDLDGLNERWGEAYADGQTMLPGDNNALVLGGDTTEVALDVLNGDIVFLVWVDLDETIEGYDGSTAWTGCDGETPDGDCSFLTPTGYFGIIECSVCYLDYTEPDYPTPVTGYFGG